MAFALSAGVVTAFNPCGFAMLPAYVSYFVGASSEDLRAPLLSRLLRAARAGTTVTLGFVTVFGVIGLVATGARAVVTDSIPFVSMVVGVVLVALGAAMIRGFEPKLSFLKVSKARSGNGLFSMYVYGLSYALVSLSCGFAGFSTAVLASFNADSIVDGLLVYIAFALGMGLVLVVISFAVAFAQQSFVRGLRAVLPYVNRASGVLLVVAGLYVAYYGYYEWRTVLRGEQAPIGPIEWVTSWSTSVQRSIDGISTVAFVVGLVALASLIAIGAVHSRRSKQIGPSSEGHRPAEPIRLNQSPNNSGEA